MVVAPDLPIPGWRHQKVVTGVLPDGAPHAIYFCWVGHCKEGIMPITIRPTIPETPGIVAGRYGLELDGLFSGILESVEGGYASSDVVVHKVGADQIAHKHIASVKYEDITITCGAGMSKGFYELVKGTLDRKFTRHNGAIVEYDYNNKERSRLSFFNALATEISFPTLDASSKDAAKMTVKLTPEYTRMQTGGGSLNARQYVIDQQVQKRWLPCNFRLQIAGLDCTRVNRIEAITVKLKVVGNPVGELQDNQAEPAHLEMPNLVVTLSESASESAKGFYDWHETFVIKGDNGKDQEKSGTLECFTPDLKEALFKLDLEHLGIFRLAPEKVETGRENIRHVQAEMYCEEIVFSYGTSIAAAVD
jgi:phage tail-like protein